MAELEPYHEIMKRLHLVERKTVKKISEHMEKTYDFKASETEYHTQFKKWNWHKNLKRDDWLYVSRKLAQRERSGRGESAVYCDGIRIDAPKVKKELSRQVHPNQSYYYGALPPSPRYVTVCTPPPENPSPSPMPHSSSHTTDATATTRKRHLDNSTFGQSLDSKRQQLVAISAQESAQTLPLVLSNCRIWRNAFFETGKADLTDLPYFQLRNIMSSEDVVKGFEQMLTLNDDLGENMIGHFWRPRSSSTSGIYQLLPDSQSSSSLVLDTGVDQSLEACYPHLESDQVQLLVPFGIDLPYLLQQRKYAYDAFECIQRANTCLPSWIASIPYVDHEESQVLTSMLLGPPTIEAARRFLEVGIFLSSNHLASERKMDKFIESMLNNISWPVLRRILTSQVPTIQSFAEVVLLFAVKTARLRIVRDLFQHQSLRDSLLSESDALSLAVLTSNIELIKLLLKAGANPNGSKGRRPLLAAESVEIAQLLVNAGGDVNAMEWVRLELYGPRVKATPLIHAVRRGKTDLAQYFIKVGADVNINGLDTYPLYYGRRPGVTTLVTTLVAALNGGNLELVEMVLREGVDVNEINFECARECQYFIGNCLPHANFCKLTYALQRAIVLGDIEFVKILIQYGGDTNIPAHGEYGETALQSAVSKGNTEIVKLLLDNGADARAPGNGDIQFPRSVLTAAVEKNHCKLVRIFLDAGVDVNIPSYGYYGCRALESAKYLPSNSDICDLLIARGAQLNMEHNNPYRQIQLHNAILKGDLSRARWLVETGLRSGIDFFAHTQNSGISRERILIDALHKGDEIFLVLFDYFDKIKISGQEMNVSQVFHEAVRLGRLNILSILLDAGANVDFVQEEAGNVCTTPLMVAVQENNIRAVRFLVNRGADVNFDVRSRGCTDSRCATALQTSLFFCRNSYFDIFHLLLQHGATINMPIAREWGRSELACAVRLGDILIVKYLLELGAKVNSPPAAIGGVTALEQAVHLTPERSDMVELLLNWGADVNASGAETRGSTALGAAAKSGHFQTALILLKAGADVNAPSSLWAGATPLDIAAKFGRLDTVHLLLKAGADMHLPEHERYVAAAKEARRNGHVAIEKTLERWKKDKSLWPSMDTTNSKPEGGRKQRCWIEGNQST